VLASLSTYAVVYTLLFSAALFFGSRIIREGPNLDLPLPDTGQSIGFDTRPADLQPDQRPAEAQQ